MAVAVQVGEAARARRRERGGRADRDRVHVHRGPDLDADGSLHFSDMPGDKRRRWHPDEGVTVLLDPSSKCNGMTLDNDGNLIVCEHVTSSVVRESPDGAPRDARHHWRRQGAEQPERRDRRVATARSSSPTRPTGGCPASASSATQELDFQGVYRIPPAAADDLELLVDDFAQPNGLCFSPDESLLYINDTDRAHIRVFDVGADHQLSNGRVFAENIGDGDLAKGGLVDGMKLDERGNVYVTGPDGVWVFAPDGEHLGVIEVPESRSATSTGAATTGRRSSSRRRRPCTACG